MSLETTLERIATALETIAKNGGIAPAAAAPEPKATKKEKPAAAPEPTAPFPVDKPAAAPAPAPATTTPFTDLAGLKQYVKTTYDELGPEKGNQMIEVLKEIGVASINDISADKYGVFFEKVEALKAS